MFTLMSLNNMLLTYKLSFDWCFDYVLSVNYDSIICMIELADFIDFRKDADFIEDVWNEKLVNVFSFFVLFTVYLIAWSVWLWICGFVAETIIVVYSFFLIKKI